MTDNAPPLEVALVNAKSASKPTRPTSSRRPTSTAAATPTESPREDAAAGAAEARRRARTSPSPRSASRCWRTDARDADADSSRRADRRRREPKPIEAAGADRLADGERDDAADARGDAARGADRAATWTRTRSGRSASFIGAQAEEYRFARYVEDWRAEGRARRQPELSRKRRGRTKLYGSLILTVSIRADGSVENVEVNRKSGQRILDAAAVKIVEMAAPLRAVSRRHPARHRHPAHHAHVDVREGRRAAQ